MTQEKSSVTFKGTITFTSDTRAPMFDRFAVDPKPHGASEITLESSESDGLILTVRVEGAASPQKLIATAEKISSFLRTMLSVDMELAINDFRIKDRSVEEERTEPANGVVVGYIDPISLSHSTVVAVSKVHWQGVRIDLLKDCLESKEPAGDFSYQEMFVSAMRTDDTVARFLILYLIGLSLSGDTQTKFETEIQRIEQTVPLSIGHLGKSESIYTKLRNQIGHVQPGATVELTRIEMGQRLGGLTAIVKRLMNERAT